LASATSDNNQKEEEPVKCGSFRVYSRPEGIVTGYR